MEIFMTTFLSLSISGSVLIILLFLCKPLYKYRLSKKWQYYIWLVVILRLLIPFTFEINLIGSIFNEATSHITATHMESIIHEDFNMEREILRTTFAQTGFLGVIVSNLWLIWIVVAIVLFVRKITIYQSFVRYVKAGRTEVEDIKELERFGKIVEQENIRGTVGLYTNSLISSPLLIGFFRPHIVLPTLDISETDYKNTIIHELTHLKRRDMFYKWLVQFVICLHWFNPFVYRMGREINNACEFSCDEAVAKNLNSDEVTAYGNTLLNSLGMGSYKNSVASITLNENKKILKDRLGLLKGISKPSRTKRAVEVALCMILLVGASVVGAYAGIPALHGIETSEDFPNPTLSTPILEYRIMEDGSTNIHWLVIEGADNHFIYLDGVSTGVSMHSGDGRSAGFTVEFLMEHQGRFHLPINVGVNHIQVRAVGDGGNLYSALSNTVIFIHE